MKTSVSKQLLRKEAEWKWCGNCNSFHAHVGASLCAGCSLEEEDIEWYIQNVESQKEASEKKSADPETPQPLSGVEEGDRIYLSSGVTQEVVEVTSRSVKTSDRSFVKSDGTGWGSNEIDAAPCDAL